MQLNEQVRPREWCAVVGQDKALAKIERIAARTGYGGRAWWVSGASGTGKTTIARLIAGEVAGAGMEESNAKDIKPSDLDTIMRRMAFRCVDGKGWAYIFNEAHFMPEHICARLLTLLEPDNGGIPPHMVLIFTTLKEREKGLFKDYSDRDSAALLDRCKELALSRQGLADPFARRALQVARAESLCPLDVDDDTLLKWCKVLVQDCKNSLRAALDAIEDGFLIERAENRKPEMACV